MKSGNPKSGFHESDVAKTLDTSVPTPQKAQGGQMVVEQHDASFWNGDNVAGTLTVSSDRQLMPDKGRLQCVVEPRRETVECLDTRQVDVHDTDLAQTLIATDYKGGKAICYEHNPTDSRIKEVSVSQIESHK